MNVTLPGYFPSDTLTKPVAKDTETVFEFPLIQKPDWISFSGFNDPVEMGTLNNVKAGSTIPILWHSEDAQGNNVTNSASFSDLVSYKVDCPGSRMVSSSLDLVKVYPGSSGLQYLEEGNWQLNWKTSKNYAGTCRNMYIEFTSGQKSPEVTFLFKK